MKIKTPMKYYYTTNLVQSKNTISRIGKNVDYQEYPYPVGGIVSFESSIDSSSDVEIIYTKSVFMYT